MKNRALTVGQPPLLADRINQGRSYLNRSSHTRVSVRAGMAAVLTGVLALTTLSLTGAIPNSSAAAVSFVVAVPAPYRHTLSITHDARESANPESLILPVSSRSVRLVVPDPTLIFSTARFRAFGANFETVGTVLLDRATHSVTIPLPDNVFTVSADHRPLDGLVADDPADYYGVELTGTGTPGSGPPIGSGVPTGPPLVQLEAHLTFRSGAATTATAPSFDLRWDRSNPWVSFDGRSSTHGEATWIPGPQTVWVGDTVTITATPDYFVQGISTKYLVDADITVNPAAGPPTALPVPFTVSADGSTLRLTIPDAIRDTPLSTLVPRINVSLTTGSETHEALLLYLPLAFRPIAVLPGTPTIASVVAANASVTASWKAPTVADQNITGYRVRTYSGTTVTKTIIVGGLIRSTTITGLTNRVPYTVDVSAINPSGVGTASARSAVVIPRLEFVLPTLTARTPAAESRAVPTSANVSATFSEPVTGATTGAFTLRSAEGPVFAQTSYNSSSRVATLNPGLALQSDRRYTAELSGIRDLAGNPLAKLSWSFVTGPAPTITTLSPTSNAIDVSRYRSLTAITSEPVIGVSSGTAGIFVAATGVRIPATVTYNAATRTLTVNPPETLASNTRYRVAFTGSPLGTRDLAGNPLVTRSTFFTTGATL